MIISRTPFRISFFGGGTDYPTWYRECGGSVLATTINKYCYITCRHLPPFFEHRSRIVWSLIDNVKDNRDIRHPSVRETLAFLGIRDGLEIHHDGDLPARSGVGSSSSFTVGLLNALHALRGTMPSRKRLAREAHHIEQVLLRENVGSQDQVSAAYGGLNRIDFYPDGDFHVSPVIVAEERRQLLEDHLMLFFTGISRTASQIAREQIEATRQKDRELTAMARMVDEALDILVGNGDLEEFGELLHESWLLKKSLSSRISTAHIDTLYGRARRAGALGGKLLGAGGGGFLLFFVRPGDQARVRASLGDLLHVPFELEHHGSRIIFYEPREEVRRRGIRRVELAPLKPSRAANQAT